MYSATYIHGYLDSNQQNLSDSIQFVVKNNIRMKINEVFDLKDVNLAHMKFKIKDEIGKILILVNEDDIDE